jgi:serine/threonine protein kinase
LIGILRTHHLLEEAQLQQLARKPPAELGDARRLAGDLLRQGWLTPFQANQIFQGRAAELVLGPYLLLERIGEGGMGQVFKARHVRLERLVSLKLIRQDRLSDPESVQRFQREAKGVALVKKSGPLSPEQACSCIRQTALGLQHIHEAGLVHRDIKPTNLLVAARGGIVKILDLGLARWNEPVSDDAQAGLTQAGTLIGTLDYLAPEQALDCRLADIRADIYSLGCTFYFLLMGQVPFPGGSPVQKIASHAQRTAPLIEQPGMPAGLQDVLSKMMAKRLEDRYQAPVEVAWALARSTGCKTTTTRPSRTLTRRCASNPSTPWLIASAPLFIGKKRNTSGPSTTGPR